MTIKSKISGGNNETASGHSFKLSDNVLIQCPLEGFAYIRVKNCLRCDHYKGLAKATERGIEIEGTELDLFMIICGKPITRRLHKVMK